MKYVIIDAEAIQKRIEELEKAILLCKPELVKACELRIDELNILLSQSTPLIPELQKTWNAAYIDALSIDEETYKPLFFEDYITNLKLDI